MTENDGKISGIMRIVEKVTRLF